MFVLYALYKTHQAIYRAMMEANEEAAEQREAEERERERDEEDDDD